MKPIFYIAVTFFSLTFFNSCSPPVILDCLFFEDNEPKLVSINIVDQNGVSETVSNPDRLQQYESVNFLACQPFQKVLRVYQRDSQGNINACSITYHENGQPKQYLEIVNGRAYGVYREWHNNGILKVEANVIGGNGDLSAGVEKTWLFDGPCSAWNEDGVLLAVIPYVKGSLEGVACYYHANTEALWKKIPYQNGYADGFEEIFFENGNLFEKTEWFRGKKNGSSERYWDDCSPAVNEIYCEGRLLEGRYYDRKGVLISQVDVGSGYKSIFGKDLLKEQQEYKQGIQEGEVRIFSKSGLLISVYRIKDGKKEGEEIIYFPCSTQPQLSINWSKGKIHGTVRSFFSDGTQESQREMAANKKCGLLTSWYMDGSLMLLEEYDQDRLVRGDYFEQGSTLPVSSVDGGKGTATFHAPDGSFLRKVKYRYGRPDE